MSDTLAAQLAVLPDRLGSHLLLVICALAAGILISLPAGILAAFRPRARSVVLSIASVLQTIPGLALLALMVPLLGRIGFLPAFLALMLYSILPVIRNTVTGLTELDPAVIEAARGVGMTKRQRLLRVQLPLASPHILAGVRTATTWVVGTATLSTPVGWPSLGNYIFEGLQLRNYVAILVGCVAAAVLAIALDRLTGLLELAARRRSRPLLVVSGVALAVVLGGGVLPLFISSPAAPITERPQTRGNPSGEAAKGAGSFVVGGKTFTEQYILTQLLAQQAADSGYKTDVKQNLGSTILIDALSRNEIDAAVDYSGTIRAALMKETEPATREQVIIEAAAWLLNERDIVTLGSLGFENAYCLAMRADQAEEFGVRTIDDLAAHASELRIGSDYEFFGRSEWQNVRDEYGLQFNREVGMDPALMYEACAQGSVDVITAYSTDGRILSYDLVVLEDTRGAFPPYDALLLLSPEAAQDRALVSTLTPLLRAISNAEMRAANKRVDVDKVAPAAVAREMKEKIVSD